MQKGNIISFSELDNCKCIQTDVGVWSIWLWDEKSLNDLDSSPNDPSPNPNPNNPRSPPLSAGRQPQRTEACRDRGQCNSQAFSMANATNYHHYASIALQ